LLVAGLAGEAAFAKCVRSTNALMFELLSSAGRARTGTVVASFAVETLKLATSWSCSTFTFCGPAAFQCSDSVACLCSARLSTSYLRLTTGPAAKLQSSTAVSSSGYLLS
jgi:hypothetical protein